VATYLPAQACGAGKFRDEFEAICKDTGIVPYALCLNGIRSSEMKHDVRGTLIQWEIPLTGST